MNQKHSTYNDGVLFLGNIENIFDNGKKKIGEEFIEQEKLFYDEMSKRDEDIELASTLGKTLSLKLKIPYRKISSTQKVKISDEIYDIYKIDDNKKETFLYLQAVIIK